MSLATTTDDTDQKIASDDSGEGATYRIPDTLHVEQVDASSATIYLSDTGGRLRIPRKLFDLFLKLEKPRSLAAVAADDERAVSALGTLVERGFLVPPDLPKKPAVPRLTTDPAIRMFDSPARKEDGSASDVAIIGVPYDFGDRDAAGARDGPSSVREISLQLLYRTHRLTGESIGWYDADSARSILAGISISDYGDVRIAHGEPQAATFERVSALVEDAIASGALPVVLGGDATVGFPTVRALAARHPLGVVQIGAKSDAHSKASSDFVSIGSLYAMFGALPGVTNVEEIIGDAADRKVFRGGSTALPEAGIPVFLSLDMAAIQGDVRKTNGWEYGAVCSLIETIGAANPICGIGLVGLNPARPGWPTAGMTALHLLMQAMNVATKIGDVEKAA